MPRSKKNTQSRAKRQSQPWHCKLQKRSLASCFVALALKDQIPSMGVQGYSILQSALIEQSSSD